MALAHRCLSTLQVPTCTTSGRLMHSLFPLLSLDLTRTKLNSTCALTEAMTSRMCISLLKPSVTLPILNIAVGAVSHSLSTVPCLVKLSFPLGVGLWNERLVG